MRQIFATVSFLLTSLAALAQHSELTVDKLVSEKSFVFVATAAFTDQQNGKDFWETAFGPAPMSINRMQNLEKNSTLERAIKLNSHLSESSKGTSDKMAKSKTNKVPVVYLHGKSALFHPSVLQPAFNEPAGKNPDSLNSPYVFDNYSVRKNKKGKWALSFNIEDDLYSRNIQMVVSPDGKAEMTISTAVKRFNDASKRSKQYYKGSIKELASL